MHDDAGTNNNNNNKKRDDEDNHLNPSEKFEEGRRLEDKTREKPADKENPESEMHANRKKIFERHYFRFGEENKASKWHQ